MAQVSSCSSRDGRSLPSPKLWCSQSPLMWSSGASQHMLGRCPRHNRSSAACVEFTLCTRARRIIQTCLCSGSRRGAHARTNCQRPWSSSSPTRCRCWQNCRRGSRGSFTPIDICITTLTGAMGRLCSLAPSEPGPDRRHRHCRHHQSSSPNETSLEAMPSSSGLVLRALVHSRLGPPVDSGEPLAEDAASPTPLPVP
jgi:hypothetical protein